MSFDQTALTGRIEHFPAEERWTKEDQDKVIAWIWEKAVTCSECGTRYEEWDPELGGDIFAYYPETYLDPGCKVIHDAYDAEKENRKDQDGHSNMNGVKVKLVSKETRMKEVAQRREKAKKESGEWEGKERQRIPFYPFP